MPNINQAYSWAVNTCNASNVGYSQTYRNQQTIGGITYYDCSSFIWYSLIAGGFPCVEAICHVHDGSHPIKNGFPKSGCEWAMVAW